MVAVSDQECAQADFFLSICPPSDALALAEKMAALIAPGSKKPVYVDCNALSPPTKVAIGNVILEAWSHGLPVVSTATDGPLEILSHGEDGLLVPREAPSALAATLIDLLLASPAERRRLGDNGKATLQRRHSEAAITQAYLDLYQRLTS